MRMEKRYNVNMMAQYVTDLRLCPIISQKISQILYYYFLFKTKLSPKSLTKYFCRSIINM